jgi:hypothetical protein
MAVELNEKQEFSAVLIKRETDKCTVKGNKCKVAERYKPFAV